MECGSRRKAAVHPTDMIFSSQRLPEESDSSVSQLSNVLKSNKFMMSHKDNSLNLPGDCRGRMSPQGSECSSSGYSSIRSNRSKDTDCDFNSHPPFTPESFGNIYENLIQSQKELIRQTKVIRQREDLLRQREDFLQQQEAIRQREDLLRQREDLLRQREDSLRQQPFQQENQEAQRKINAVGDEQHLKCGTTHSYGLKCSDLQQARESLKSLWKSSSFQNSAEATEERNTSQSTGRNHQQNQNQNQSKTTSVFTQIFTRQKTATNTETQEQKSDLKMEEEKHLCQRIDMIEKDQQEDHQKIRNYLNQVEKEVTDVQWRLRAKDEELKAIRSVLKEKEEKLKFFKDRLKEKDDELQVIRFAVHEKDEELKSFKDRVAGDVASSIKTGKAINLNNPVSKPRIIELYEDLRYNWPKIKSCLRSKGGNENSSKVRDLMQKAFYQANAEMTEKINHIDGVFDLNMARSDTANPKVKEYRQLTIQNLQLAIYSEKQQDLKSLTPLHQCKTLQHVLDHLKHECFWLGRLMALNDPPLEPDWLSPPTTCDKWDILPHNIIECQKDQQKIKSSLC